MEASANITDSPDEVPKTENPQAIGGETSMEEDVSYMLQVDNEIPLFPRKIYV